MKNAIKPTETVESSIAIFKGVKNQKIVQITETVSIPVNILAAIPKENLPKVFWKISPKPTKTGIRTISEKRI